MAAWVALRLLAGDVLQQMEDRASDFAWRIMAKHDTERRVIVVDIDDRSLREVGPWPWPRDVQARLLDQIAAAGARQQILDIVFTDGRSGDGILADAVHRHRPLLAQVFALEQGGQTSSGILGGALGWATCPAPFAEATGYLANIAALQPAAAGHITPRIASDGMVRHQPAVICHRGGAYPALGIAAMMQAADVHTLSMERGTGWLDSAWSLTAPQLAPGPIPLDERGDLRVSWRQHPDSFISLSASDVLAGRIPDNLLTNAWVLVGSSAFGLNDSIATPYGGASSGLQAHLQILTALIDGRTPYTPRAQTGLQIGATVLGLALLLRLRYRPGALASRTAGYRFPIYLLPLVATGWALLLWCLHAILLVQTALWVGWLAPALFAVLAGSAIGILEHAKSRIDRDQLYTHLSSYLPAPVAAALALQPPSSAIRASTQQVSVLFADIRNFSAYCESRPPEEAAAVLHAFFSTATRVIERHGGVIEAFQGDAIIAVWNGTPQPEGAKGKRAVLAATGHAQLALQAAVDLLSAMRGVLPDPAPAGLEPLSLGIGVETGLAMAGSFGLASRRTHMVMGRTVTIASRLVGMTAELSHPILVGEGLAGQVGGFHLESMGTFLLDGMRVPHHIYAHPLNADTAY
ncbi:MAG: adenylate/guanylate cyclase domain-containing protein [Comamonadaceae bacterium]|nr:adenylate/guanylate cyclase domain-containing protein [Comamonadaceae bacterium]